MQLVLLAAGFGTRFGGLKQLAAVGPNGEAIMDYTAQTAAASGFDSAVIIVRPEIEEEMRRHVAEHWPTNFPVTFTYQPPTRGTGPAVLAAAPFIDGPFAVCNADDLYGEAIGEVAEHFGASGSASDTRHLLLAYRLEHTVIGDADVKRGLCRIDGDELVAIAEHLVSIKGPGSFEAVPVGRRARASEKDNDPKIELSGTECVSMNLWGFHRRIFDHLRSALDEHHASGADDDRELLLPDVVEDLIEHHTDSVRVTVTDASCIGITNRDDLDVVRGRLERSASPNGDAHRS